MEIEKNSSFISIVAYVHNSERTIKRCLPLIYEELCNKFSKIEFIFVDDASDDDSINLIKNFAQSVPDKVFSIINMGNYQGLEASMRAGVDLAIGDFVFEFDSLCINYDISLISTVFQTVLEGYDIVSASPKNSHNIFSAQFYNLFNSLSNLNYELNTEVFRVLSRRAINRVNSMSVFVPYRKALYASCNLKMSCIKYNNIKIPKTEKLISSSDKKKTAIETILMYTNIAFRLAFSFSVLMVIIMISAGIYVTVVYFGQTRPVTGWAPIMGLISLGFFGIFSIFTIVIKYLELLLKIMVNKQKYLISSIEKLNRRNNE